MDDFLHNLRSGKLKQQDRNRSIYNDQYKGKRRSSMDHRRKSDHDSKEAVERLDAIKGILEGISQTQQRLVEVYDAVAKAEVRKAEALEIIAKGIQKWFGGNRRAVAVSQDDEHNIVRYQNPEAEEQSLNEKRNGRMTADQRKVIFDIIDNMRQAGESWTNIARHLGENGYSTVSGKGTWRGQGVKAFYTKMGGAAA